MDTGFQRPDPQNPSNQLYNSVSGSTYSLQAGTIQVQRSELQWKSALLDCQFLKIGSKGWQKGKIRIQVIYNNHSANTQFHLEFSPDEPPQPESPLDDLRELPEYKQQL